MTDYPVSIIEPRGVFFDTTVNNQFDNAFFDNSAQTLIVSDTLSASLSANATMTETTTISDAVSALHAAFVIITEGSLRVVDSILTQVLRIVNIYEPGRAPFDGTYFDNAFFDNSAPTYPISDSVSGNLSVNVTISESSISISDALARLYNAMVNIAENNVITEQLVALTGYFRNIFDPAGLFDNVFFDNVLFDTASQTIQILDQVVVSLSAKVNLTQTVIISELLVASYAAKRIISEVALATSDTVARAVHVTASIVESALSITESITASVFRFAFLRIRKTVGYVAKRVTSAFVATRKTSGDVE